MNHILVPLDGDVYNEYALPVALSLAHQSRAAVTLARVDIPRRGVPTTETQAEARVYLDRLMGTLPSHSGLTINQVVLEGEVAEALLQYASKQAVDLIVLTSQEQDFRGDGWQGDVKDQIARQATVPLLIAHARGGLPDYSTEITFKHILVDLDGTPEGEAILAPAVDLGRMSGAEFTLLRVTAGAGAVAAMTQPEPGLLESTTLGLVDDLQTAGKAYLETLAQSLRAEKLKVTTEALVDQPGEEVLEVARARGVDLIAMTTDTRSEFTRWVLRSGKDQVLREANMPVLQVRATQK